MRLKGTKGPKRTKKDQKGPKATKSDQKRPKGTKSDQKRPIATKSDQKRSKATKSNQNRPKWSLLLETNNKSIYQIDSIHWNRPIRTEIFQNQSNTMDKIDQKFNQNYVQSLEMNLFAKTTKSRNFLEFLTYFFSAKFYIWDLFLRLFRLDFWPLLFHPGKHFWVLVKKYYKARLTF